VQCPSLDVKQTLYELLFQFMQYNWRYFFHSSVTALKSVGDSSLQHVDNRPQFVAIVQVLNNTTLSRLYNIQRINTVDDATGKGSQPVNNLLLAIIHEDCSDTNHCISSVHDCLSGYQECNMTFRVLVLQTDRQTDRQDNVLIV